MGLSRVEGHCTELLGPMVEVPHEKELEVACLVLRTLGELVIHDEFIVVSELRHRNWDLQDLALKGYLGHCWQGEICQRYSIFDGG